MASVAKRKWIYAGREREAWVVRYKDKGGAHRSRQFEKKKDADEYKRQVENELEAGMHVARAVSPTVAMCLAEYLGWLCDRSGRGDIGENYYETSKTYGDLVAAHIGGKRLVDLHWSDVQGVAKALRATTSSRTRRRLSNGTVRTAIAVLSASIKFGIRRGYVARNVVQEARPEMGTLSSPPIKTFSVEQVRRLLSGIEEPRQGYSQAGKARSRAMIYLAACCGLRKGEVLGIGEDVIDFDRGTISVRRQLGKGDKLRAPKTSAGVRVVPMPPIVASAIREYLRFAKQDDRGLIFRTRDGSAISHRDFDGSWRAALARAGLAGDAGDNWHHFHALRHFAGSAWLDGGVPLADVSKMLGHANVMITARVYAHAIAEPMARAAALSACAQNLLQAPDTQELRKAA